MNKAGRRDKGLGHRGMKQTREKGPRLRTVKL